MKELEVFSDSQLVVSHVNDDYKARELTMARYLNEVHRLASYFDHLALTRVPQAENTQADALAKLAST